MHVAHDTLPSTRRAPRARRLVTVITGAVLLSSLAAWVHRRLPGEQLGQRVVGQRLGRHRSPSRAVMQADPGTPSVEVLAAVVTYNSARVVGDLLDSLPDAMSGLTYRVVVVDNGSQDGTAEAVEGSVDLLVRGENVGYAAAINAAVDCAVAGGFRPESVLVLNPDVVMARDSVAVMLEELRRTGAGVVTPLVREQDGRVSTSLRRDPSLGRALGLGRTGHPRLSEWVLEADAYARPHDADWAVGAVLLVSMDCHEDVGGWDASYFLYSEETDFCLRARDRGWRTRYVPSAEAMHIGGASGESALTHTMQIVNRVRLYRRRHGPVASAVYYALTCLKEVSWMVRGQDRSRTALAALLVPSRRPPQLGASSQIIPR